MASTFTQFIMVNKPANVEMVDKAYYDIINVKIIPDKVLEDLKQ